MTYGDQRDALRMARTEDVLEVGGDARCHHRAERLKSVVAGLAAGALAYVAMAHGPWLAHPTDPAPTRLDTPVEYPSDSGLTTVSPPRHGRVVVSRCPVRVHDVLAGGWVCFGSADAATSWLTAHHAADESFRLGGP